MRCRRICRSRAHVQERFHGWRHLSLHKLCTQNSFGRQGNLAMICLDKRARSLNLRLRKTRHSRRTPYFHNLSTQSNHLLCRTQEHRRLDTASSMCQRHQANLIHSNRIHGAYIRCFQSRSNRQDTHYPERTDRGGRKNWLQNQIRSHNSMNLKDKGSQALKQKPKFE